MDRGLIVGAIAFAVGFAAERLYASMAEDIARYDSLRRMSGQSTLAKEILGMIGVAFNDATGKNGTPSIVSDLTNDLVRYATLRGM